VESRLLSLGDAERELRLQRSWLGSCPPRGARLSEDARLALWLVAAVQRQPEVRHYGGRRCFGFWNPRVGGLNKPKAVAFYPSFYPGSILTAPSVAGWVHTHRT
jgi:hypothetical protein